MTKPAAVAKSRRTLTVGARKSEPAPTVPIAAAAAPAVPRIVPSSPRIFSLEQLYRAPENVRHTRVDEAVPELAADIAAHGLLQSLIGYQREADDGRIRIGIVGGGRRLQALEHLRWDGAIGGEFPVPVLIRDVDEAVELSLAENLQQRTMSPVDEFCAFSLLMKKGDTSPAELAKRFGFSERVVKQRLRLADLADPILAALGAREITIDAAMAYASTQDKFLQQDIFEAEAKRGREPHRPSSIRHFIDLKGMRTTDPVFRFVGAQVYERDGGGYEDDLFRDEPGAGAGGRVLDRPFVAETAARSMIDLQAIRLIEELKADRRWAPTIVGHVIPDDLRVRSSGVHGKLTASRHLAEIDRRHGGHDKVWRAIRDLEVDVHIVVGIDDAGELRAWPHRLFVARGRLPEVERQAAGGLAARAQASAARAEEARLTALAEYRRRLAVPSVVGTPLEGRLFWPPAAQDLSKPRSRDGIDGWYVTGQIWVSDAEIAAQAEAAEALYAEHLAARARDEAAASGGMS